MLVTIPIEFEVETDDEDGMTREIARDAAMLAAYDYLSLCEISGYSTDVDNVEVHVEGFGNCTVSLTGECGD